MQMSKDGSLKKQSQGHEQRPQSRRSRTLQSNKVNGNRLRFSEDGSPHCELVGLLPFGSDLNRLSHESALAIELAIRHLNEGDGTLVSELDGLSNSCPITFSASFFDTRRSQSHAFSVIDELTTTSPINPTMLPSNSTTLVANSQFSSSQDVVSETTSLKSAALPCAFVGAIDSQISETVALVTGLRGFPQISSGSTSSSLSNKNDYPLFGRTIPDDAFSAEAFVRLLHENMGVRHLFVIYESHPYTRSIISSIRDAIVKLKWEPGSGMDDSEEKKVMYVQDKILESDDNMVSENQLRESIHELKTSEYRFVVALTTRRRTTDALMQIAYDNEVAGTPDGNYRWWFFESLEDILVDRKFPKNSTLAKAYDGAGNIAQTIDKTSSTYDKFLQLSTDLKRELYNTTQHANNDEEKGLFSPEIPFLNASEWFQEGKDFVHPTTGFSYDAAVLLGLSACEAVSGGSPSGDQNLKSSLFLEGNDYFEVIKQMNFTGITGDILLDPETGTRDGNSVQYTITNWVMKHNDDNDSNETDTVMLEPTISYVYAPGGDENWEEVSPFIFRGGKTIKTFESLGENPGLPPPEYNNVNWWIQAVAGAVCALIIFTTIGCAIWVHQHKNSRVIRASQPFFLLLICLGIGMMALAMIPASLEHCNYSNSRATCNSYFALIQIGFGITFSTFLAKTYRINKIMDSAKQFKRIKLSVRDTIYPVAIVLSFNVIMLTIMIVFGPIVHKKVTGKPDKFGRPTEILFECDITEARPYMYAMIGMDFVLLCLALFQAWKARNLATEFAESRYIGNALMISTSVLILVIPVLFLLDESPDADTFIHTSALAIICGAIIGCIFVPKMWKHYKYQEGSIISKYSDSSNRTESSISGASGERILTTKSPQELALDIKKLERELSRMKKEGNELQARNTALRKRVQELTGVDESNGIVSDVASKENSELSNTMKEEEEDIDASDSSYDFDATAEVGTSVLRNSV